MKTFKLFSMAALALAMAACSNEDNELENVTPAQQGTMHFTATVAAPGSGAMTRTTYSESGTTINVAWKAGDQIYLFDEDEGQECTATVGTPAASGSATISGTFDYGVEAGENITATYPVSAAKDPGFSAKFASQAGTLTYIQDNLDYRIGHSTITEDGDEATLVDALEMKSQIAIWKLTLTTDGSTALSATKVTIKNGSTEIAATTDISATSTVYLALNLKSGNISGADITIEATVGSDTYTYSASGVSLAKGNYYQSTVTLTKPAAAKLLSTISSDYTAQDGDILTGTLGSNVKISIADGAKVTLKGVNINGSGTWTSGDYAGITCEGDATIILEGVNTVKGFADSYPGIFVSSGKTLVIKGTGELNASSSGSYDTGSGGAGIGGGNGMNCGNIEIQSGTVTATGNNYGAGIGCGYNANCGNITISGGTVTATGGWRAAGIGGGKRGPATSSCGNITISGGTITATGGEEAAGIGGGRGNNPTQKSSCGTITITSGVTSVTATKGSDSAQSIGAGKYGTCGAVTIEDGANVTQN